MIKAKPFSISRRLVYMAYQKVRSNKGTAGIDNMTLNEFEKNHRNLLYKVWNQMSSGSYMPPAVKLVEIPKKGGGTRPLGIPTVADRIAQTVVRGLLEPKLESVCHASSYGCRMDRNAHDAVTKARERCWKQSWVLDLDIEKFYDTIPHDLLMKAVMRHCSCKWMLLHIERWLAAPVQNQDGAIAARTMGVPQGSVIGPVLANLYLHYCLDVWLSREYPQILFERYMDDMLIHCQNENEGQTLMKAIGRRLEECGLRMHPMKTKLVFAKTVTEDTTMAITCRSIFLVLHLCLEWLNTAKGRRRSRTGCLLLVRKRCKQ